MLFLPSDHGQGLVEYALIMMCVALVVLVMIGVFGPGVGSLFSNVINSF